MEGARATDVWFIKRGTIVLARAAGELGGVESPRAIRRAGAFVGLEALVRPNYLDSARVPSAAVVCGGPREQIDEWLGAHGSPLRMAFEQLLLAECDDEPRGASSDGSATARVARWILREADASHETAVPRRTTAGLLGMVPETFSRALGKLATAGAIEVTRRSLRVKDADTLRAAAGG